MKKFGLTLIAILSLLVLSGCCLQHQWEEATCSTPRTCSECSKTDGEPLGHEWKDATCTEPKVCTRCEEVGSEALGHQYENGDEFVCDRCGEEKLFRYSEMDGVFYGIKSNYKEFDDTYGGKKMLMQITANGGIDSRGRIVDAGFLGLLRSIPAPKAGLPDISVHITYAPAKGESFSSVENFDSLTVRATLDDVSSGWFDGQYFVEFRDTEIVKDGWN